MKMENVTRWKEIHERSMELADVSFTLLSTIMDYCKSHDIPLYKENGIWNLVNKAQSIIKEIENLSSSKLPTIADESLHESRNRRRLDRIGIDVKHIRYAAIYTNYD